MLHLSFPILLATAAETLLNHALQLAPHSLDHLTSVSGKRVKIEVASLKLALTLFPSPQHILVFANYTGEVDAHIQGEPFSLLRLLLHPETNLANVPEVQISGDVNTVHRLQQALHQLEIDWEEHFSKLIGDVPAHSLGNLLHHGHQYLLQSFHSVQQNIEEYLHEETHHLPAASEVDNFLDAIDTLRDDVARLEQRVLHCSKAY